MIALEGVDLSHKGRRILGPLTLSLPADAGLVVLLGANGAGKSLLLRLIHGLEQADQGMVDVPERQAMMFQTPIFLNRSVNANLNWAFRKAGITDRQQAVEAALREAGLESQAGQNALKLSGGEAQRLALARAHGCAPDLLLLDEPTAALDPAARQMIGEKVRALADDGLPILMSTHSLAEAHQLADVILFMADGKILEQTPAQVFFDGPQTEEAKRFLMAERL